MKDTPYTERLGGSYVRDKSTGELRRADQAQSTAPALEASAPAATTEPKKGK